LTTEEIETSIPLENPEQSSFDEAPLESNDNDHDDDENALMDPNHVLNYQSLF
jgi:hypothetical protein